MIELKDLERNRMSELVSTVDISTRISNITQNVVLILDVAYGLISNAYNKLKSVNYDYQKPVNDLNERPGL